MRGACRRRAAASRRDESRAARSRPSTRARCRASAAEAAQQLDGGNTGAPRERRARPRSRHPPARPSPRARRRARDRSRPRRSARSRTAPRRGPGCRAPRAARRTSARVHRCAATMSAAPATRHAMPIGFVARVQQRVEAERDAERDRHERQPRHEPRGAGRLGERDPDVVGGLLRVAQRSGERAQALGERRADRRRDRPGRRHVGPLRPAACDRVRERRAATRRRRRTRIATGSPSSAR